MDMVKDNVIETGMTAPFFRCRLCGEPLNEACLSVDRIPVCNRFTTSRERPERHDLRLDQCSRCQLIQLGNSLPIDAIVPRHPWIKYREPESHLDAVVDHLLSEYCSKAASSFGVGPFDQPLLYRLERRGLTSLALDVRPSRPVEDVGFPYLESWQCGLNEENIAHISSVRGRADLVSCRYLLEHCHDPLDALRGLQHLVSTDGVLLIEVPDSTKFLAARDYSFIWEEHISYFVESTLRLLVTRAGYTVLGLHRYSGDLEDALVIALRPSLSESEANIIFDRSSQSDLFRFYVSGLQASKDLVRSSIARAAGPHRDGVALFGIGHQAVMFVNIFDLSEYVTAVVDDDPNKCHHFPPGFDVPVISSQTLLQDTRIRMCLFAVAPGNEQKIREKLAPLADRGVHFRSIFTGVSGSLFSELT